MNTLLCHRRKLTSCYVNFFAEFLPEGGQKAETFSSSYIISNCSAVSGIYMMTCLTARNMDNF